MQEHKRQPFPTDASLRQLLSRICSCINADVCEFELEVGEVSRVHSLRIIKGARFGDSSEVCKQLFQLEASMVRSLHIRLVQHLNTLTTLATLGLT